MIDLETLGRRPDAIITQIGALFFSPENNPREYGEQFIASVDVGSQKGRTVTTDTIQFWLAQPHDASAHIVDVEDTNLPLISVLREFRSFLTMNTQEDEKLFVWANGAAFDFPIIDNAFEYCDMKTPWEYHQVNDLRTLRNLVYPKRCHEKYRTDAANGKGLMKHDALNDCIQQVAMLQELIYDLQNNAFQTG